MSTASEATVQRLEDAESIVNKAGISPDLRAAAFILVYQGLEATEGSADSRARGAQAREQTSQPRQPPRRRLEVPPEMLERIYDLTQDPPELILPRRALSSSQRTAMAEVTRLVLGARQGLGTEEWTASGELRRVCQELGVFDRNFARVLERLNGQGMRIRGRGREREINMNATGFEETGQLIERIAAELG
jgi:hypothetical protein